MDSSTPEKNDEAVADSKIITVTKDIVEMVSRSRCSFKNCSNKETDKIRLFHFPKNQALRDQWLKICNNDELLLRTNSQIGSLRVCQEHFTENCFSNTLRTRISKFAVPTLGVVKPATSTTTQEVTPPVPVPDSSAEVATETAVAKPMVATSTTEELEIQPAKLVENEAVASKARSDASKLDILVCGKCKKLFHFTEQFLEHKQDIFCLKPEIQFNIAESKATGWAFLLWKANCGIRLKEGEGNSWTLYKRWMKLPEEERSTWVQAGAGLMATASVGRPRKTSADSPRDRFQPKKKKVRFNPVIGSVGDSSDENDVKDSGDTKVERDEKQPIPKATRSRSRKEREESGKDSADELENYIVEKILAKRFNAKQRQFEYLLKWEGYPNEQNTWEPVKHMESCEKLVETFERNLARQKAMQAAQPKIPVTPKPAAGPKTPTTPKAPAAKALLARDDTPGPSGEGGRPCRSSKTKAMANVKTWCGSIGKRKADGESDDSEDSSKRPRGNNSDESSDDFDEEVKAVVAKSPPKPAVNGVKRGPGRPPGRNPANILKPVPATPPLVQATAPARGPKVASKVPSLSSGVYVVSGQSGVVRLSSSSEAPHGVVRATGPPQKATGVLSTNPPPLRPLTPRVLGSRPPRPPFVPRPPNILTPKGPPTPRILAQRGPRQAAPRLPGSRQPAPQRVQLSYPSAAQAKASAITTMLGAGASANILRKSFSPDKRPAAKAKPKTPAAKAAKKEVEDSFDEDSSLSMPGVASESEEEPPFEPPSAPSPPSSPPPLTLCPETGKLLGDAQSTQLQTGESVTITRAAKEPAAAATTANVKSDEFITVSGESGVLYRVAANGVDIAEGVASLLEGDVKLEEAGDGKAEETGEVMTALDAAVAEAVAQMMPIAGVGANSRIVMMNGSGPLVMTTGENGEPDVEAQIVAQIIDDSLEGTTPIRRVVLLMPDGNFMLTEIDEDQYIELELEK